MHEDLVAAEGKGVTMPGFQCLSPKEGGVLGDVEKHYGEKECGEDIRIFVPTHASTEGQSCSYRRVVCCFAWDSGFT